MRGIRWVFVFLGFLSSSATLAQSRALDVETHRDGDTYILYFIRQEKASEIGLSSVQKTSANWYFRFWNGCKVIDLIEDENGVLAGTLICWVKASKSRRRTKVVRTYSRSYTLDSNVIAGLLDLIQSTHFLEIPRQDSIRGWRNWVGGFLSYECADESNYVFRDYCYIQSLDTIKEVAQFGAFFHSSTELVGLKKIWANFSESIPFKNYSLDNGCVGTYLPRQEKRKRLRLIRKDPNRSIYRSKEEISFRY